MALLAFQRVLLSLYTDESFFDDFTQNQQKALQKFDLSDREQRALRSLPLKEVRSFSQELRSKRRRIVAKMTQGDDSSVFFLPAYKRGATLLFRQGKHVQEILLPSEVAPLFSLLASRPERVSFRSLLNAAAVVLRTENALSFRSLYYALRIARENGLSQRIVRRML